MEIYVNLILFASSFAYCDFFFWIITHYYNEKHVNFSLSPTATWKVSGRREGCVQGLSFLSTQALTFISVLGHEHSFSTFNITELYFTV